MSIAILLLQSEKAMKKNTLLFYLLVMPVCLLAQWNVGLKAGLNYANVRDYRAPDNAPELADTKALLNFHAGAFVRKNLATRFDLQVELLYNQKGTEVNFVNTTNAQRFHYLSVPVLLSWEVWTPLRLNAGTELNFLLATDAPGNFRVLDEDRKVDLSGLLGISVDLSKHWIADVRYAHGLLSLSDVAVFDQVAAPEAEYKWFNQVWQFSLGYYF
jgi:hypothetical protein